MKILQLVSDWKWTGPAQPMLVLMGALRAAGHTVELVCPSPPPGAVHGLRDEAITRGLAPIASIEPGRGALRIGDAAVVAQVARWLGSDALGGPFDLVHVWHSRDHVLAARALARTPLGRARAGATRIVRTLTRAEAIAAWPWNRWLFGPGCDGLACVCEASARASRRARPRGPIAVLRGGVELAAEGDARASAEPAPAEAARARARATLGVAPDAKLIGVVARMQSHRRFDLLLEAMALLAPRHPEARLVVLGRGTRADALVREPARTLGLAERVVLAGHRRDDYAALLAAMDLFTYLVPGSDGTCRALLEAAALALPLVGTRRGAIPEIIVEGETGLLVDETPESLAAAWSALLEDPSRRIALAEAARRDARSRFSPARFAEQTLAFYAEVLRSAPTSSR